MDTLALGLSMLVLRRRAGLRGALAARAGRARGRPRRVLLAAARARSAGMVVLAQSDNLITLFVGHRAAVDPALRALRHRAAPAHLARVRPQVPGDRLGRLGHAALRAGAASTAPPARCSSTRSRPPSPATSSSSTDPLLLTGIALCATGLAFKASVAPFHQWTPDVYQGAPTPITTFMAVATKAAAFAIFLRLFDDALGLSQLDWGPALAALAAVTIVVGNVGAIPQRSLKRMLAWSSVAQAGYLLAGVVVGYDARAAGHGLLPGRLPADERGRVRGGGRARARVRARRRPGVAREPGPARSPGWPGR